MSNWSSNPSSFVTSATRKSTDTPALRALSRAQSMALADRSTAGDLSTPSGVVNHIAIGASAWVEHLTFDRPPPRPAAGLAVADSRHPAAWRWVGRATTGRRATSPRNGWVPRVELGLHGSEFTSCSTGTRGPVKNGVSARVCRRASVARNSRIRSTMRSNPGASKARSHS